MRDRVGIGSGSGRDWVGVGSGSGRDRVGIGSGLGFTLRARAFCWPGCLSSKIVLGLGLLLNK
jgi:hypothetical protein